VNQVRNVGRRHLQG